MLAWKMVGCQPDWDHGKALHLESGSALDAGKGLKWSWGRSRWLFKKTAALGFCRCFMDGYLVWGRMNSWLD